jgi:hypothetical protein
MMMSAFLLCSSLITGCTQKEVSSRISS